MARCKNCGAPLLIGSSTCAYCKSSVDIDLSGRHYYTSNLPKKKRPCPNCKIEMDVLNITRDEKPFYLERCPKCLGLFFDIGELDLFLKEYSNGVRSMNHSHLSALRSIAGKAMENTTFYRPCPICGKLMNHQNYGQVSGVVIDRCRDHGVFLDAGELQKLAMWIKAGGHLQEVPEYKPYKREDDKKEDDFSFLKKEFKKENLFGSILDSIFEFLK
jgi:Zn-finger nucleic acid-binding protein